MRKHKSAILKKSSPEYIKNVILDKISKFSINSAYEALNIFSLGNFSKAIKDVFVKKYLSNLKQDDLDKVAIKLIETYPEVKKEYFKKVKNNELDRRHDNNRSTRLDPNSIKLDCMFSGDEGREMLKIADEINKELIEAAKYLEKESEKNESKNGFKNIPTLSESDNRIYSLLIMAMRHDKKSDKEILSRINKVRSESMKIYNKKLLLIESKNKVLKENKLILSEEFKEKLLFEAVTSSHKFWDTVKNIFKKTNSKISNSTTKSIVKFLTPAVITTVSASVIAAANVTLSASVAPALAFVGLSLLDKYKREIRNGISAQYKKFKNDDKFIIAEMLFNTKPSRHKEGYILQFSTLDFKWRCLNKENILHYPTKKLIRSALDSEYGKKFREFCRTNWDPLFKKVEGKETPFKLLVEQDIKILNLRKSSIKYIKNIGDNYERIEKECLNDTYKYDERPRGA